MLTTHIGDPIREEFLPGPVDCLGCLVVIAPARRAGDPGSNPGPGQNFFSLIINKTIEFMHGHQRKPANWCHGLNKVIILVW